MTSARGGLPDRPIRVAYLNGSLDLGGSERQMVELARRLPRDRFAPEFVLLTGRGPLADLAESSGVPVRFLRWARPGQPWRRLRRIGDLARYVRTTRHGRYDIIDAWLFHAYAIAALTRPITSVPTIIAGRRSSSDFKEAHGWINRALDEIARRRVDAIVANSEGVRRDVTAREGIAPDRIDVIRNGVELPPSMRPSLREAIRRRWGASPDHIVIGCVANYKARKGLETIVDVAALVGPRVPQSIFVLVGEGPLRGELERRIVARGVTDRVRLHGSEPDAREIVGAFDIALQASLAEGLPNAVLEPVAHGVPVVATNVGGTPEIVVDGSTGCLVEPDDELAMAEAIIWLAASRERRERFGQAGRVLAADRFGMDRFVAETAAFYERVLARRLST